MAEMGPTDASQAFLYVSGEMDAAEAAAFERRLGEEQPLREALCQAVQLLQTLQGLTPPAPRPAYREHVRRRLRASGGLWRWVTDRRTYPGHPALWSGLGAVAAFLVMLAIPPHLLPVLSRPPASQVAEPAPPAGPPVATDTAREPTTIEVAEMWASMHNHDHLARAQDEENRRRLRLSGPLTARR